MRVAGAQGTDAAAAGADQTGAAEETADAAHAIGSDADGTGATFAHTAVYRVSFVLKSRFLVGLCLLPLLSSLHAHHRDCSEEREGRHRGGKSRDHYQMFRSQAGFPGSDVLR